MSEENNKGQNNGDGNSHWRAQIEADLVQITKRINKINKLQLREEFRAAKARKESAERAAAFEQTANERAAAFEQAMNERAAAFEREQAERQKHLDYITRLVRALGDKTFELDERISQAGAVLSGDSTGKTGI